MIWIMRHLPFSFATIIKEFIMRSLKDYGLPIFQVEEEGDVKESMGKQCILLKDYNIQLFFTLV